MKAFLLIFAGRLRSLMDRISDSGSDGWGSIPHGGTRRGEAHIHTCKPHIFFDQMTADISKWWAGLKVSEKERVATKIAKRPVSYPECTAIWNSLSDERQRSIYEHCSDAHGYLLKEWFEGNPLTD